MLSFLYAIWNHSSLENNFWQSAFRPLFRGSHIITLKSKGQTSVTYCVKSQETEAEKFSLLYLNINCSLNSVLDWHWSSNLKCTVLYLTSKNIILRIAYVSIFNCPPLYLVLYFPNGLFDLQMIGFYT